METTRHVKITRPTTITQTNRLPEPTPASQVESTNPLETGPQLTQATQLGHQLGQIAVVGAPGLPVQAKLTVGAANDPYEQEADRVAGQVMRMAEPGHNGYVLRMAEPEDEKTLLRQPEPENEETLLRLAEPEDEETLLRLAEPEDEETLLRLAEPEEEESLLQRAGGAAGFAASNDVEQRIQESRGQGAALAAETRAFMEPRFGADFSQVSLHTDAQADQLNRQLSARAFTTGRDIFFRQGAYTPGSAAGKQLLAHELTHVVQQGGAGQRIQRENGDGDDTPSTTKPAVDPVANLKTQIEAQRAEIYAIRRENQHMLNSEIDDLDMVLRKLNVLSSQLTSDSGNYKKHMKAFKDWREGDGVTAWETFDTYRKARAAAKKVQEDQEAREAAEAAARRAAAVVTWSAECDAVFADMNNQYQAWDGSKTNRGAWWGSAQPGATAGARRVPNSVVLELQRRIRTPWRFSDSFSGGVSFHRTRGSVDFIYHMLPP